MTISLSTNETYEPGTIVGRLENDGVDQIPHEGMMPYFIAQQRVQPTPYQQPTKEFETFVSPALARAHTISMSYPSKSHTYSTTDRLLLFPINADPNEASFQSTLGRELRQDTSRSASSWPWFQPQLHIPHFYSPKSLQGDVTLYSPFPYQEQQQQTQATVSHTTKPNQIQILSAFWNFDGIIDSDAVTTNTKVALGSATDKWKNEAVKVQPADGTYFLSVTPAEFNMDSSAAREGRAASAAAATLLPSEMPTRKQAPNATVEERFQCILEQVVVAGFESFDAMATAYYALNFSSNSALADEQRLSRSRRLPRVISDIHSAASSSWSDWERRGFLHEILRTAEVILSSEGDGARPSVGSKIVELVQAQDIGDTRVAAGAMFEIKRVAQGQLPNIWAVAMALAAGTGHRCNRDRSDVALATTLILSSATSISSD